MDQRSICLFVAEKRLSALDIHDGLGAVLGARRLDNLQISPAASLSCNFFRTIRRTAKEPSLTIIDKAILDTLYKQPFSSVREFAKPTCIPKATVHRHLTSSLGFGVKHLLWVPHELTDMQKGQGDNLSNHYCASSAQSKIKVGNSLSLLTSRGSPLRQTMSRSGFEQSKSRPKDEGI
jgi:hypothetical protein